MPTEVTVLWNTNINRLAHDPLACHIGDLCPLAVYSCEQTAQAALDTAKLQGLPVELRPMTMVEGRLG